MLVRKQRNWILRIAGGDIKWYSYSEKHFNCY